MEEAAYISPDHYRHMGAKLHDARISKRLTLEKIAALCNIRSDYITAIEEGRLEDLPGKSYVRGFIQQYAKALQLNPQKVWEDYALKDQWKKDFGVYVPKRVMQYAQPSLGARLIAFASLGGIMVAVSLYMQNAQPPANYVQQVPQQWWQRAAVNVEVQPCLQQPFYATLRCTPKAGVMNAAFPWLLPVEPLDSIMELAH